MSDSRTCLDCGKELMGRIDQKFCSPYCKSSYHYDRNKSKGDSLFKKIDNQLKLNRRILKNFNKAGKATVRKEVLLKEGFNPKNFTHYYKTKDGNVYLFCYEYGFMQKTENDRTKFVLVQWQNYMDK